MAALTRNDVLTVALTTIAAAVPFAYAFVYAEIIRWVHEYPLSLSVLFLIGIVLSFVGATLPRHFRLPLIRSPSLFAQIVMGAILGGLVGLVAGASGWIASSVTMWALLIWFFFGSLVLSIYFAVVPRRVRDG